jgi:hypothetical protein
MSDTKTEFARVFFSLRLFFSYIFISVELTNTLNNNINTSLNNKLNNIFLTCKCANLVLDLCEIKSNKYGSSRKINRNN